jgi:hypothetical protein
MLNFAPNLIKIQRIFSHFRFFIYNLPLDHSTPGILDPFFAGVIHQKSPRPKEESENVKGVPQLILLRHQRLMKNVPEARHHEMTGEPYLHEVERPEGKMDMSEALKRASLSILVE